MVGQFMQACLAGDIDGLTSLLAEDVTAWMDSGGKVSVGATPAGSGARQGGTRHSRPSGAMPEGTTVAVIEVNGLQALLVRVKGKYSVSSR